MKEMSLIEARAVEVAMVSARAFGIVPPAPPITPRDRIVIDAARLVLELSAAGQLFLPRTLAWARGVVHAHGGYE